MIDWINSVLPKRKVREALVLVTYEYADRLLKSGYTIAREEDNNQLENMVWLEKVKMVPMIGGKI